MIDPDRTILAGHSMGAYIALLTRDANPQLVRRLVLVDGGVPLPVPEGIDLEAVLGPALARLRIFWPGTTMRCSANCSPGLGLNGSGFGLTKAGHMPSGSSRDGSPFLSATFTT